MIHVTSKPGLFTREFLEMTFGAIGTAALKVCLKGVHLGSDVIDLVSRKLFTSRIDYNVLNTEIDTENTIRCDLRRLRNLDYDTEINYSN